LKILEESNGSLSFWSKSLKTPFWVFFALLGFDYHRVRARKAVFWKKNPGLFQGQIEKSINFDKKIVLTEKLKILEESNGSRPSQCEAINFPKTQKRAFFWTLPRIRGPKISYKIYKFLMAPYPAHSNLHIYRRSRDQKRGLIFQVPKNR